MGAGSDRGQSADGLDPLNPYLIPQTLSLGEVESREASLVADWLRALAFVIDVPDGSPFSDLYWEYDLTACDWPEADHEC